MERPPRWLRATAWVLLAGFVVGLTQARAPLDIVEGVLLCGLALTAAIAPRGLYDGRFQGWAVAHPFLAAAALSLVMGLLGLGILRDFIDLRLSLLISAGFAVAFAVIAVLLDRRPSRQKPENQ